MSKRDIRNQLKPNVGFEPQVVNTDTTTVGEIIDTADFDGGVMLTHQVTWTSGTFTPLIEESDSPTFASGVTEVADTNLIGDVTTAQEANAALTSAQLIASLGVVNNLKRYLRYSCVSSLGANGVVGGMWHKDEEIAPITNP